jgi:phosphatidate cytidylyltransferase
LAPAAFACIWVGGWPWSILIALGTTGLAVEWVQLCGQKLFAFSGAACVLLIAAAMLTALGGAPVLGAVIVVSGACVTFFHARVLSAGIVYIGLPCVALVWLRADPLAGRANFLLLIFVVWATDIGAYVFGRWLGGPKLAPRVSPGKTWSGAVGGLLTAILIGLATASSIAPRVFFVAAALSLVAQAGDLLESGIKRHFGVKDSGRLIPGHGGLLDRLDGVLTAALLAAMLAYIRGRGVLIWL